MILDIKNGQELTAHQLAERLACAPRILVGEQPDNPDHHALALWMLQVLVDRRAQGSLLLDAITPEQQAAVDQVRANIERSVYPSDLPAALSWQQNRDWSLYGPILRYVLGQPYPVLAANLAGEELDAISRQPEQIVMKPEVRARLAQVHATFCEPLSEEQAPVVLAVRHQRDRRMAERLAAAPLPALLFAGRLHVHKDVGIPSHLAELGVDEPPLVVMLAEAGTEIESDCADYVWYTGSAPVRPT